MKKVISILLLTMLVSLSLVGCGGDAGGGEGEKAVYPTSTIKIIVPYTAGGGADLMARTLAPELSKLLGATVIVENQPGGGGAVAMSALANSKADGYTLVLTTVGASTLTPNSSDVGYTNVEFAPIAQVADVPDVLCVHKNLGVSTWEEFLEYAQANPGTTYGTSGARLTQNVQIESILSEAGLTGLITHIPFDGGAASVTALLGEQVNATANIITEVLPHSVEGTFVPLLVSSPERDPLLPDVPTATELGYSVAGGVWYGIAAPAGTDEAILETLDKAIAEVTKMASVQETFTNLGNPVNYLGRTEFTEKWMSDYEANKEVLEKMEN